MSTLDQLPARLTERARLLPTNEADQRRQPKWVLYWLRTAMRGHDNPALDVAVVLANERGLPVVVYQELRADGPRPYPNDRHHLFALQGARDLHDELHRRGIAYALHVQRAGDPPSHLEALTDHAASVVVEDLPVYWHRQETDHLAARLSCPLFAVDTACIVPHHVVPGDHDRAFRFRDAHSALLTDRLHRRWTSINAELPPVDPEELPFDPVDARTADLVELVSRCPIDHSVAPVADTHGGSAVAYARWRHFRDHKLARYHDARNDAARPTGVSRLSAYLHYGQISPFRVAWQAAALDGEGPEKFLDELITWREFAHHIGRSRPNMPDATWLPRWARQTLQEHRRDPRPALYDWETLARGRTDDELWNLAQTSLLAQGELHNNLRMTWGKALLQWTDEPHTAIDLAIDLNDRYALDGADPNSYLGILWCFGAFDRPFSPPQPILGEVRPRSTKRHAKRLDLDDYRRWVRRPPSQPVPNVAIVGAGIAGLSCARILSDHRLEVEVFDKARGPGGRASTRHSREGYSFDHGAQYFTARTELLRRHLNAWRQQSVAALWDPKVAVVNAQEIIVDKPTTTERFVATPGNNALCAHLGRDLRTHFNAGVADLERDDQGWTLHFDDGEPTGPYDRVVLTPPAPQIAHLLADRAPTLAGRARSLDFSPTWALMVVFADPLAIDADAIFINDGPLSWMARDASKPGRPAAAKGHHTWVVHASPEWSRQHLELSPQQVEPLMVDAISSVAARFDADLPEITHTRAHRWRFARADGPLDDGFLCDPEAPGLFVCGDWLAGSRIEGAFTSGAATAGRILAEISAHATGTPYTPAQLSMDEIL